MQRLTLNKRDEGDGRPVVFVHGVGADLSSWDGVVQGVSLQIRAVRYDLRGHGGSPKVAGPYTVDLFVSDLLGVMDGLGQNAVDLVGFSLGGLIIQEMAVRYPERVRSLCLISTVNDRTREEQQRVETRAQTLQEQGADAHLEAAVERWFSDEFRVLHPEIVEQRVRRSLENDPQCYAAAYRVLADGDLRDRASAIRAPTLIMTGEEDQGSSPRMARALHAKIPNSELFILKGLRHSVLLEAPQMIAGYISDFYRKSSQ